MAPCPRKHCAVAPMVPVQYARAIGSVWDRLGRRTAGWRSGHFARCACTIRGCLTRPRLCPWQSLCAADLRPKRVCSMLGTGVHRLDVSRWLIYPLTVVYPPGSDCLLDSRYTAHIQPPTNPWLQRGPRFQEGKRRGQDGVRILARPRRRRLRQRADVSQDEGDEGTAPPEVSVTCRVARLPPPPQHTVL